MAKVARFALNGVLDVAALLMVVMVADLTTRIAYSEAAVAMRVDAVTHCATARPVASERPRGGRRGTATVEDYRSIGSRVPLTVPASGRHPVLATPCRSP
ncbi:hypothetical protein ASG52_04340 [Methylobacterium sp. Leaf456]|uniref:hypothetical protein n=1 Tax=Methylobacterium sp. Leaf456 TaxID=1736382 RepID=UPI000700941B|nr:hypothetical protein [Methylobacterium sp. Leaf456]KQT53360.1 hypothetical protein ASG52_04340 [Methylobacterium sp. Leaf456]